MKRILLINASPRTKGTSVLLARMCADYLAEREHDADLIHLYPALKDPEGLCRTVHAADILIVSGPCYINTYPADVIAMMELLSAHREILEGKSIYGIIQGGMPYPHTHESGLNSLRIFAEKCGMNYKGGFVMGMGPLVDGKQLSVLPHSRKILRQLNQFFRCVEREAEAPASLYEKAQLRLPVFVFRIMAAAVNRKIDQDLKKLQQQIKAE